VSLGRKQSFSISRDARLSLRVNLSISQDAGRDTRLKKPGTAGGRAMKSQGLLIFLADASFRFYPAQLVERHGLKGMAER